MDIAKVANLANLSLTHEEIEKFAPQFEQTLQTIDIINQLDTSSTQPTAQVTGLVNVLREDVVDTQRMLPVDLALSQARQHDGDYFVS